MKYIASVAKRDLGYSPQTYDPTPLQPGDRRKVIEIISERAIAEGWKVVDVLAYEEFGDTDLSAGRVTLDVFDPTQIKH